MKTKLLGTIFIIIFLVGCSKVLVTKQKIVVISHTVNQTASQVNLDENTSSNINPSSNINSSTKVSEDDKLTILNGAKENSLIRKRICIDPGHGNPNHEKNYEPISPSSKALKPATAYGTTGVLTKIPEYKLTMAISLKLRSNY